MTDAADCPIFLVFIITKMGGSTNRQLKFQNLLRTNLKVEITNLFGFSEIDLSLKLCNELETK